jgi:hypothetical protein
MTGANVSLSIPKERFAEFCEVFGEWLQKQAPAKETPAPPPHWKPSDKNEEDKKDARTIADRASWAGRELLFTLSDLDGSPTADADLAVRLGTARDAGTSAVVAEIDALAKELTHDSPIERLGSDDTLAWRLHGVTDLWRDALAPPERPVPTKPASATKPAAAEEHAEAEEPPADPDDDGSAGKGEEGEKGQAGGATAGTSAAPGTPPVELARVASAADRAEAAAERAEAAATRLDALEHEASQMVSATKKELRVAKLRGWWLNAGWPGRSPDAEAHPEPKPGRLPPG